MRRRLCLCGDSEGPQALQDEAEKEGVKLEFLVSPKRIIGQDERVKAIEFIRMKLGAPDESGRPRPEPIKGSEFTVKVDAVIPAIGQAPDFSAIPDGIARFKNTILVNPLTLETTIRGVFAGGDLVSGPATIVEAIASGKRAAESIDRHLKGVDMLEGRFVSKLKVSPSVEHVEKMCRVEPPSPLEKPVPEAEYQAIREAKRCLLCSPCSSCLTGENLCEPRSNVERFMIASHLCRGCLECTDVCGFDAIRSNDELIPEVIIDGLRCKACSACVNVCPTGAITATREGE